MFASLPSQATSTRYMKPIPIPKGAVLVTPIAPDRETELV